MVARLLFVMPFTRIDVSEGDSFMASEINFRQCNENVIILFVVHRAVI